MNPIKQLLLAFQLENYNNKRFIRLIYRNPKFLFKTDNRQKIDRTNKLILLSVVWLFVFVFLMLMLVISSYGIFSKLIFLLIFIYWLPQLLIFANVLISPIDNYFKNKVIKQAKNKLKKLSKLRVIWITGSYWKTSQKEILNLILSEKFNVVCSEWNKNTPLGVSEQILRWLDGETEIFIVEMGAYWKWDIKQLCELVNPSIWILTWITQQHLERFGSIENIIDAKFELIEYVNKDGIWVVDLENVYIQKWLSDRKDSLENENIIWFSWIKVEFKDNLEWIKFNYKWLNVETKLLAEHSAKTISMAMEVWFMLGMENEQILNWISKIDFVPHRLQLIHNPLSNIYVLDDSYNWNPEWVKAILNLLKNIKFEWRKIYLTPGLVEMWDYSKEIHTYIWETIADYFDKIILIKNSATHFIKKWLSNRGYNSEDIIEFESTEQAHSKLANILNNWDLIVFQNDWTDNYF